MKMLSDQALRRTLATLDTRFRNTSSAQEELFCSKLALIELCGWIEQAMDDIVCRCSNRRLANQSNIDFCDDQIVGTTYGFEYKKHFRGMLIRLVGIIGVERIETQISNYHLERLKSSLGTLTTARNGAAHTHITGATPRMTAPSVLIAQLDMVLEDLNEIDKIVRKRRW